MRTCTSALLTKVASLEIPYLLFGRPDVLLFRLRVEERFELAFDELLPDLRLELLGVLVFFGEELLEDLVLDFEPLRLPDFLLLLDFSATRRDDVVRFRLVDFEAEPRGPLLPEFFLVL